MNLHPKPAIICTVCQQEVCAPCGRFAQIDYKTRTGICKACAREKGIETARPASSPNGQTATRRTHNNLPVTPPLTFQDNLEQLRDLRVQFPQSRDEFLPLTQRVCELAPQVFVEIGTREGGSLWMLAQYLPQGATIVSIDLVNGPWGRSQSGRKKLRVELELRRQGFDVHLLEMDSQSPQTVEALRQILGQRAIDFLFIDGDHTLQGVQSDWKLYSPLVRPGGMVAFHDIMKDRINPACQVDQLWDELKKDYRHEEFRQRCGIGILWKQKAEAAPRAVENKRKPTTQPQRKPVKPGSYAFTHPYTNYWLQEFYDTQAEQLFKAKVVREQDFRAKLQQSDYLPELMLMGNFVVERGGILSLCRELGINTVHTEDGFMPHYRHIHTDPLGFCWESALTRQLFRSCSDKQRQLAHELRTQWLAFKPEELPQEIQRPFVFWPLQLIGDKVNKCGLNVESWVEMLRHFRKCLPGEYQLVIKAHPRSRPEDNVGVEALARELPNTVLVPRNTPLKTLIQQSSAVAGANSTVLYEARLMFHKPVYTYGQSWFTNHAELFMPVRIDSPPRDLNRLDFVDDNRLLRNERLDDYTDWFTAQLQMRQLSHDEVSQDPQRLKEHLHRFSYHSYQANGDAIFE